MSKVWFVTGSSRGFGRLWVEAALDRGDKVAATARDASSLAPLAGKYGDAVLTQSLDVTDHAAVDEAVRTAHQHFGRLDVVVNNAGYGHFGSVEETTEAEARAQLETNFFGALWVTQAAIPLLREQGGGHIIQISSIGGVRAFPLVGIYHASKWALEGLSESLAQEVAGFGIKVTIVEPGGYATDWAGSSAVHSAPLEHYEAIRAARSSARPSGGVPDPAAAVKPMLAIVDAAEPPLRILLGSLAFDFANAGYQERLRVWAEWETTSREADHA
jgi:NAD(P)-dependent dehydrogenase (short-subunit alcohol dehydrogenase family)